MLQGDNTTTRQLDINTSKQQVHRPQALNKSSGKQGVGQPLMDDRTAQDVGPFSHVALELESLDTRGPVILI
ncbi:hypothetical protein B7463_g1799, partial [Scytalidium lignicola]